jgi:hypothetical protein
VLPEGVDDDVPHAAKMESRRARGPRRRLSKDMPDRITAPVQSGEIRYLYGETCEIVTTFFHGPSGKHGGDADSSSSCTSGALGR